MKKHPIKEKKILKKFVREEIASGKSRQQLFLEIKNYYKSKHALAVMVGEYPESHLRKKYRPLSLVLGSLLMITALLYGYDNFENMVSTDSYAIIFFLIPVAFIAVGTWTFQFVPFGMRLSYYVAYIALPLVLYRLGQIIDPDHPDWYSAIPGIALLVLGFLIVGISSHLWKKLTPGFGLLGPKPDRKGNYELSD